MILANSAGDGVEAVEEFLDLAESLEDSCGPGRSRAGSISSTDDSRSGMESTRTSECAGVKQETVAIATAMLKMASNCHVRRRVLAQTDLDVLDVLAGVLRLCKPHPMADQYMDEASERIVRIVACLVSFDCDSPRQAPVSQVSGNSEPSYEALVAKRNCVALFRHPSGIVDDLLRLVCMPSWQHDSVSLASRSTLLLSRTRCVCNLVSCAISQVGVQPLRPILARGLAPWMPIAIWHAAQYLTANEHTCKPAQDLFLSLVTLWNSIGSSRDELEVLLAALFRLTTRGFSLPSMLEQASARQTAQAASSQTEKQDEAAPTVQQLASLSGSVSRNASGSKLHSPGQSLESPHGHVKKCAKFIIHFAYSRIKGTQDSKLRHLLRDELLAILVTFRAKEACIGKSAACNAQQPRQTSDVYFATPFHLKQTLVEIDAMLTFSLLDFPAACLDLAHAFEEGLYLATGSLQQSQQTTGTSLRQQQSPNATVWIKLASQSPASFLAFGEFVLRFSSKVVALQAGTIQTAAQAGNLASSGSETQMRKAVRMICNCAARIVIASNRSALATSANGHQAYQVDAVMGHLARRFCRNWMQQCFAQPSSWPIFADLLRLLQSECFDSPLALATNTVHQPAKTASTISEEPAQSMQSSGHAPAASATATGSQPRSVPQSSLSSLAALAPLPPIALTAESTAPAAETTMQITDDAADATWQQDPQPVLYFESVLCDIAAGMTALLEAHFAPRLAKTRPRSAAIHRKQQAVGLHALPSIAPALMAVSDATGLHESPRLTKSAVVTSSIDVMGSSKHSAAAEAELAMLIQQDLPELLTQLQSVLLRVPRGLPAIRASLQSLAFALTAALAKQPHVGATDKHLPFSLPTPPSTQTQGLQARLEGCPVPVSQAGMPGLPTRFAPLPAVGAACVPAAKMLPPSSARVLSPTPPHIAQPTPPSARARKVVGRGVVGNS
ncbi:hypothetical protein BC831DRAFT_481039 [Entophlyctis helioformis]|nr:hypothetical protein BC831DRAFT_481039 [Entophlyctis helioformis]